MLGDQIHLPDPMVIQINGLLAGNSFKNISKRDLPFYNPYRSAASGSLTDDSDVPTPILSTYAERTP